MSRIATQDLFALWDTDPGVAPHARLTQLLAAAGEAADADTLGARNTRVLSLHQHLVRAPIEAHARCAHCATDNEFPVPIAAVLATPAPPPDAAATLDIDGQAHRFRLPRMTDIAMARRRPGAIRDTLLQLCSLDGAVDLSPEAADAIGAQFEDLDPAANVVVLIECAGCKRPIQASIDIATFVARDLDRLVDSLLRDIDVIAGAYGWTETEILALGATRRRRYVRLIATRRVAPVSGSQIGHRL